MKKRLGFVSNSSSSSFLLGIAVIEDEDKFNKWWETLEKDWSDYEVSIKTIHDLTTGSTPSGCGTCQVEDEMVEVSCFRGDSVSLSLKGKNPADRVLIIDIANNEGDDGFPSEDPNDRYSSPDHNIDLDFLGQKQVDLYHGTTSKENGLVEGQVRFGAARNG